METTLGYAAMIALGIVLGLIGAGGSILTVPILVYLLNIPPTQATGYSLVIVGTSALVGAIQYLRRAQSNTGMAILFGLPAIAGVYITRRFIFPAVPDPVFSTGSFAAPKDVVIMVIFASFMLLMALSMIRSSRRKTTGVTPHQPGKYPLILITGFGVGVATGFVGAGGGFMILPVLVLLGGLPMKVAIGTDLLIIAAKSLIGFVGEVQVASAIDFGFVALITLLPIIGIFIGSRLNRHVPAFVLQRAFGWFVLVMGLYIVVKELML